MPQLPQQEVDRQGQLGGRQHFFPQLGQDFLQRLILRQTLPQGPEKVGLLDVFFAIQQRHGWIAFWCANGERCGLPNRTPASTAR